MNQPDYENLTLEELIVFYGLSILGFGIAVTKYGEFIFIESVLARIIFGGALLVAGYLYFKKHFGENEDL